ncbi:hypothetical protein C1646_765644 [Rhizophagus diaphanus]|nr:hypothetical protein C1646_765644 [Rhizophagus diaphanus] [Rhizophagus sp. MUCL 43196]
MKILTIKKPTDKLELESIKSISENNKVYSAILKTYNYFNYLLDKIENIIDNKNIKVEIKNAATAAKNKLKNIILLLDNRKLPFICPNLSDYAKRIYLSNNVTVIQLVKLTRKNSINFPNYKIPVTTSKKPISNTSIQLGHIINLTVQEILKIIKAGDGQEEDELLELVFQEEEEDSYNVDLIPKLR